MTYVGRPTDLKRVRSDLTGSAASEFSANIKPDTGTAAAKAVVTDEDGNVYVVGNSTGSFGSAINQASEDVFLTKYDSAGAVQWTKLLGSAGSAGAYSLALDPTSGSIVVAGSVTGASCGSPCGEVVTAAGDVAPPPLVAP
jgi:hypothetical protein